MSQNNLLITSIISIFCLFDSIAIMGQEDKSFQLKVNEGLGMRGDVNGDGLINSADIVEVVNEIFLQPGGGKTILKAMNFIVRKSGGGDYTSLTKAITDNMGKWGVTIYVDEGEYDLLEELKEYYGTENFLSLTPRERGIELGYDITIKGSPNAIIKADYKGNDVNMLSNFSPFNSYNVPNTGGFSLVGVNIKCSRVRYVIHDEKSGVAGTYNNLYDNCNFYIDNTNNESWGLAVCIGGGLGKSGCITIRNCIFEGIYPNRRDAIVSYHNASVAGARSYISCMGNFLKGDRGFRFSWYGASTDVTEVLVEGNNVGRETIVGPEPGTDSPNVNVSVTEWNTVVRYSNNE